jgi:heat-inducible transcriptional repressor
VVAGGEDELQRNHNLLDDVVEGRTLGDLRELFHRRLQSERVQHDDVRRRAFLLGGAAVDEVFAGEKDLVIEGQDKLLEKPEFQGSEDVRRLVTALDDREKLVGLLDLVMQGRGTHGHVAVGEEIGDLGGGQLAIVGAAYTTHGQAAGAVGVIGPTRMDYPHVLPLVAATANAMSEFLGRDGSSAASPRRGQFQAEGTRRARGPADVQDLRGRGSGEPHDGTADGQKDPEE